MRRGLVLGAGGPAGIAWEVGLAVGLADAGIDLRSADVLVGTSAGSVVAVHLASGASLEEMFAQQVESESQVRELRAPADFHELRLGFVRAREAGGGSDEILRRVGALAVSTPTVSESERRAVIAARLGVLDWPPRELRIVAVEVDSGRRIVFDRHRGVDLVDAVAASCAVPGAWPPATIDGARYIDGGAYSTDNADLAADCGAVVIVALRAQEPRMALVGLDTGVQYLMSRGVGVTVVHPDEATEAAFASVGGNLLDPSVRERAARAGRDQGARLAGTTGLPWGADC